MAQVFPKVDQKVAQVAQVFPKVDQKVAPAVFTETLCFQNSPQKITKYFGYFCAKICCQELSKMAHSGHTALI